MRQRFSFDVILDEAIREIDKAYKYPYNKSKDIIFLLIRWRSMIVAKVTSKGQVTIPKKVRDSLGVHPGEEVGFEKKGGVVVITKVVTKSPFDKWVGKLRKLQGQHSDDLVEKLRGH